MDELRAHINKLRHDFGKKKLLEGEAGDDPIQLFDRWFLEAVDAKVNEPNAMTLATSTTAGMPSQRIVLLRNYKQANFVFYTNYLSRKGKEIAQNPVASLLFFWPELERQIRINGKLSIQTEAESDEYFASRPRESQLGAWVSEQSAVISGRQELDLRFTEIEKKFSGRDIPRPHYWGGYILNADAIEFWQGRPGRLHDRLLYSKGSAEKWTRVRLAP